MFEGDNNPRNTLFIKTSKNLNFNHEFNLEKSIFSVILLTLTKSKNLIKTTTNSTLKTRF